jgi:3-hydroxybenzoate 6-monooxygenase
MSSNANQAPVLVVGGGIGGLSTALALARKGVAVQVLEQAPEFMEIGAGIQLGPNVFRMFEVLGLTEQMFHWCAFPEGLEFRDSITAETIVDMKIDQRFHDKYHAPYGVIHRADMLNVILDACKKSNLIKLATSQKVIAIDDTGGGVTVKIETGETYTGAALIGCDGLWSTVRETIVGDGKPVVSGHIAYRAVLPTSEWPAEYRLPKMIVWCGEKTHLVHYPLRRGELFNLVVVFHSDRYEEGWDTYGDPAELHERFKDKCEPVRTLLQKVNAWKMWVLCDRPAIKNWSKGRITLLGDAAHPMLQYLAQGGNTAMEDAVCLANQVEAMPGDYEGAFKKYQELRYLRTARVQLMARVFGEIYHASGVNRELRNKLLHEWSQEGSIDMSWLYGHQPELPRVGNIPMPPPTRLAS